MGLGAGTCKRQAQSQGSREARVQIQPGRRGAVRVSGSASPSLSFLIFQDAREHEKGGWHPSPDAHE